MFFNSVHAIATAEAETVLHPTVLLITHILLAVAIVFAMLRFIKGPDAVDRLVCLDLIAGTILVLNVLQAITQNDVNFMNIALALAVVAFISTVATARYLERKAHFAKSPPSQD